MRCPRSASSRGWATTANTPGHGDTISAGVQFVRQTVDEITSHVPDALVLVTWDESGGYFDHVAPLVGGLLGNRPARSSDESEFRRSFVPLVRSVTPRAGRCGPVGGRPWPSPRNSTASVAIFSHRFPAGVPALNAARHMFLYERSRPFYPGGEAAAPESVSGTRCWPAGTQATAQLMAVVGELATRGSDFQIWWGGHAVRARSAGMKEIHHPVVGDMTLGYEMLTLASGSGHESEDLPALMPWFRRARPVTRLGD
ncbi:Phosphoesterase family protein [Nakamurella panacisegetis]|uniref:Phosphoesterase family protein n=1 Tax=Nakamurella panacisegetis TaxID=1090615 RepID=A0A1H0QL61_9ACTN|nr:Phosphoesterase family protein [Nakamurella panacisegetis]